MRLLALAVLLAAGCASNDWPDVESMHRVVAGEVMCDGAKDVEATPVEVICSWTEVQYGGAPHCYVVVIYQRADASAEWHVAANFPSAATCGG